MPALVLRDLVYGSVVGFRPLTLDLHLPDAGSESAASTPVILFVHGGGWRLGSKAVFGPNLSVAQSFDRIVAAGFAVASVDYRLSGEAKFPAQVDDVRTALGWIREHGAEYGIDGSRIILWGESAGSTLGALVALEPGADVLGVVDWYGPSDLISFAALSEPDALASTRESEWLGTTAIASPEVAKAASPVFQVSASAPPFLIAHGTADKFVPFSQSEELADVLRAHGVAVDFTAVEGANHMWNGVEDVSPIMTHTIAFARGLAFPAGPIEPVTSGS